MSQARSVARPTVTPRTAGAGATSPRLGLALLVIATAQLMVVLDLNIVTVALPHIQTALHFSGSNLEWVVNAYAVAFGGLLLLGGRPATCWSAAGSSSPGCWSSCWPRWPAGWRPTRPG